MNFSKMKEMREKAGMSQKEVAEKLSLRRSTVSMWETGKSEPRLSMLPNIAEALNCTVNELYREVFDCQRTERK